MCEEQVIHRRTLEETDPEKFRRRYGYYPSGYVHQPPATTGTDSSRANVAENGKPTPRDFILVSEDKMALPEVITGLL